MRNAPIRLCGDGIGADSFERVPAQAGYPPWLDFAGIPPATAIEQPPIGVLVAEPTVERLEAALTAPARACWEVGIVAAPAELLVPPDGLYLSLSAGAAYHLQPARVFAEAIAARLGDTPPPQTVELALHEAVVNALVHGNLGIGALPKDSVDDFMRFCDVVEARLVDPVYASRRLELCARWSDRLLEISVKDEGPGYDPAGLPANDEPDRKSGRGLLLIRHLADRIDTFAQGRGLTMVFTR